VSSLEPRISLSLKNNSLAVVVTAGNYTVQVMERIIKKGREKGRGEEGGKEERKEDTLFTSVQRFSVFSQETY
jgi:hypothetical protein